MTAPDTAPDRPPLDLPALEAVARDVATACGRLIVDERPERVDVASTKTSAVDVVTVMDARSEQLAHELLSAARPHDALLGEEGLAQPGTTGITWVVDPIDGTVNYLYGIPAFAVSVAAVEGDPAVAGGWRPVAAAVFNPSTGELFSAHCGGGARLSVGGHTRTLDADPAVELGQTLLGTGFSYEAKRRAWQGALVAELLPQVRDIRRIGSAALDLCSLAAGRLDAYYESGLHPWDLAGGWLVAAEAGLVVQGATASEDPSGRLTLAGRRTIVDALAAQIASRLPR